MYSSIFKYCSVFCLLCLILLADPTFAISRQEYVNDLVSKASHYSCQEGKSFLAINYINKAVKLQPSNLDIYYERAVIYARLKLFTEAIKDLNLIIRNARGRKKYTKVIKYRAECFAALGEYRRAITDYKTMINKSGKTGGIGKIYYYYAELLWYIGNRNAALRVISSGKLTGSHWIAKMKILEKKIIYGERLKKLHRPFSN